MSVAVPADSIVSYTGVWGLGLHLFSADSFVAAVKNNLAVTGLTVLTSQVSGGFLASLEIAPINVSLAVQNHSGINMQDDDFLAAMDDAIEGAGATVISESIIAVGAPGQIAVSTGLPSQVASNSSVAHVCGDPSWGILDDPGQWFSCLTTKGLSTLGLVFIGLALGLVLVFTSKRVNPL